MWRLGRAEIGGGEIVTLTKGELPLSVGESVALWRTDAAFRDFFIAALAASPWRAFFWEMPPLTRATLFDPFECAVIASDVLAWMQADDADFAEHLRGPEPVAMFSNIGGDALLIAPRRMSDADCYGHIAAFVRQAPRDQQHAMFHSLALEIDRRLATSQDRFWVSTSGLGVPWVHVRLDTYPKYYQYRRYAEPARKRAIP